MSEVEDDGELVNDLTKQQATKLCQSIRDNLSSAQMAAYCLKTFNGWVALGYKTWAECCSQEFGTASKRHVDRMVLAYEVKIDTGETERAIPESVLRPLSALPRDERKEVWEKAKNIWEEDDRKPTNTHQRPRRLLPPARMVKDTIQTTLSLRAWADRKNDLLGERPASWDQLVHSPSLPPDASVPLPDSVETAGVDSDATLTGGVTLHDSEADTPAEDIDASAGNVTPVSSITSAARSDGWLNDPIRVDGVEWFGDKLIVTVDVLSGGVYTVVVDVPHKPRHKE